jgi:hypothetical protein
MLFLAKSVIFYLPPFANHRPERCIVLDPSTTTSPQSTLEGPNGSNVCHRCHRLGLVCEVPPPAARASAGSNGSSAPSNKRRAAPDPALGPQWEAKVVTNAVGGAFCAQLGAPAEVVPPPPKRLGQVVGHMFQRAFSLSCAMPLLDFLHTRRTVSDNTLSLIPFVQVVTAELDCPCCDSFMNSLLGGRAPSPGAVPVPPTNNEKKHSEKKKESKESINESVASLASQQRRARRHPSTPPRAGGALAGVDPPRHPPQGLGVDWLHPHHGGILRCTS